MSSDGGRAVTFSRIIFSKVVVLNSTMWLCPVELFSEILFLSNFQQESEQFEFIFNTHKTSCSFVIVRKMLPQDMAGNIVFVWFFALESCDKRIMTYKMILGSASLEITSTSLFGNYIFEKTSVFDLCFSYRLGENLIPLVTTNLVHFCDLLFLFFQVFSHKSRLA